MDSSQLKPSLTSALAEKRPFTGLGSACENEQLALPLTDNERKASRKQLEMLHPGNRFRLMFGQPLLPQGRSSGASR